MAKYKPSIFQEDMSTCYLCGYGRDIEVHHVYGGPNRKISTRHGCVVALCRSCHTGDYGVHKNADARRIVQQDCQRAFEEKIGSREYFMSEFGRNYL